MGRKEEMAEKVTKLMYKLDYIRNIGTAAHIDHGKTTLSDSLIAAAGLISEELAGQQLFMDYDYLEQQRGITIQSAAASMVHHFDNKDYLVNLIDTPGHVDFGGDVTRAMRALDGVIIVVCAVEAVMPQTETVIRQALKERVKPILFINKVDRLINEVKFTPEQTQERFKKIIYGVNSLIEKFAPEPLNTEWQVSVEKGTVIFGSAVHKWGTSVPYMKKKNISFKQIYEYCISGRQKELSDIAPLYEVVLDSVVVHHPTPLQAQKYRIPVIWHGEPESEIGKAMLNCKADAPVAFMVTKIIVDPQAGEVAVGRIYSGTLKRGDKVYIAGSPKEWTLQQVSILIGADRMRMPEIVAGNIAAVQGVKDAAAGNTVSTDQEMEAFEKIVHYSEPVVTVAIEAKHTSDLPKLIEVLRTMAKADPSLRVEINQETGEHLLSGMGELHLEIAQYRIINDHKVDITASQPIVVYRERVGKMAGPFEGKSPNKHNRFYIEVSPLEETVVKAIQEGKIHSDERIKDAKKMAKELQELGMDRDDARGVIWITGTNMLTDVTKGIQNLNEAMELCKEGFLEAMGKGPLANETCMGMKVRIIDAKLHDDSIHRGPAQVIPAVRYAIYGAMCRAGRILLEPVQKVIINVPIEQMGGVTREMQQRRSVIEDIEQEGELAVLKCKAPVAEMFGFSGAIRGATTGRALWSTENAGYVSVPKELLPEVVRKIRERKGLQPEPYDESHYAS